MMSHSSSACFIVGEWMVGTSVCSLPARSTRPDGHDAPARCTSRCGTSACWAPPCTAAHTRERRSMSFIVNRCRLLRDRQHVQDGVGGAALAMSASSVLEGLEAHRAPAAPLVFLLVVAAGQVHDQVAGALEELLAVSVRGHHGAVAGRARPAPRPAVHRVGGEHAGARAQWAGGALHPARSRRSPWGRRPSPWVDQVSLCSASRVLPPPSGRQ